MVDSAYKSHLQYTLDCALNLKRGLIANKKDRRGGLCLLMGLEALDHPERPRHLDKTLKAIFTEWPEFSGELSYPIGSKNGVLSPQTLFNTTRNMWSTKTAYGKARWRLLDFVIKFLQEEIQSFQ